GEKLIAVCRDELGNIVQVESEIFIAEAHTRPLSIERLKEQFGRLGNTPFYLDTFINHLNGNIMLPVSELNRMRREIVSKLEDLRSKPKLWQLNHHAKWQDLITNKYTAILSSPSLIVLVRNIEQLKAVLTTDIKIIYCEFEDPRNYKEAVKIVRESAEEITIFVAPPRITKPGETWILKQVHASQADGYLIRNYDQLEYFANEKCVGDFSLNIANPLTADYFKNRFNLERLTVSYDLNINQLEDLITNYPAQNFEVTIHQHIPMFHMEHCVFCAFLSTGTDYTNCGRPCDTQAVTIRDRVGSEHILKADAGCRNTVYNSTAQTGAEYVQRLIGLGLQHLRIEFVNETREQVQKTIQSYQKLLKGEIIGSQLWRELKLQNQLGVTRGALRIM
ncbi:DUF3656 domain-containing protein, partial [Aphanizomenon flos-aquae FACHB-1416]